MSKHAKRWTQEHTDYVNKHAKVGYVKLQKLLQKRFGETWATSTIKRWAKKEMIEIGFSNKEVPLVWILTHPNRDENHPEAHPRLVNLAKREGVVRRSQSCGQKLCVPTWWADQIAEELEQHGEEYIFSKSVVTKFRKKLTENEARQIIKLKGKYPQKKLAKMFNVSVSNIKAIQLGRTWKHLHA